MVIWLCVWYNFATTHHARLHHYGGGRRANQGMLPPDGARPAGSGPPEWPAGPGWGVPNTSVAATVGARKRLTGGERMKPTLARRTMTLGAVLAVLLSLLGTARSAAPAQAAGPPQTWVVAF